MTDETFNPEGETTEEPTRNTFETFLYHQRRALEETAKALESLLPEGFRNHGKQATNEFTAGLRVLVDAAIEEIKKANDGDKHVNVEMDDDDDKPSSTGKMKVKVQVE